VKKHSHSAQDDCTIGYTAGGLLEDQPRGPIWRTNARMTEKQGWSTPTRVIVVAVCLVVIGLLLYRAQPLVVPLVFAGLLAYVLNLIVRYLSNRTRLKRKWAVNIVYFVFIAILIATPSTLIPVSINQAQELSAELEEIAELFESLVETPVVVFGRVIPLADLWAEFTALFTDFDIAVGSAISVLETTTASLLRIAIIIVVTYYLMMDWGGLERWIANLLPESGRSDFQRLVSEIDTVWRAYLQGTLALMIIMAIVFIIIGLIIGLPGAVAIGILTGILSMIPEIGPWIAGVIAVLVAFVLGSDHLPISNFWFAVLVAGIYFVLTQVKGIWVRPQVMRRFMRLNTGLVFIAILGAAMLGGILAALIILPIIASIGVIGRYIRARLLDLEPWPEDEQSEITDGDNAEPSDSPQPG
jgi:predicted PurR-regulated permease PerM